MVVENMRYLFSLYSYRKIYLTLFLVFFYFFVPFVYGLELESLNFQILDPVLHDAGGDEMTSLNFRLRGSIGQPAIGESDANNFSVLSGFLYFRDVVATPPPPPPSPSVAVTGTDSGSTSRPGTPGVSTYPPSTYPPSIVPCERIVDLNCDGNVDLQDLSIFLFHTKNEKPSPVDFNKGTRTGTQDLSMLFSNWPVPFLAFSQDKKNGYGQSTGFYQTPKLWKASEDEYVSAFKSIGDKISAVKQKAMEATSYGISVGKQIVYGFKIFLKTIVSFIYDLTRTIFSNVIRW